MSLRLALLIAAGMVFGQEATIRVDVQQVLVPVVVTDKKGHHVSGLRASDFRIFEDGVAQEIASLSSDTEAPAAEATAPRHTFVICIDTLHASPANAPRMRQALESLFEKEKPSGAQYVLIAIGHQLQVLSPASANPLALLVKIRTAAFQNALAGMDAGFLAAQVQNVRSRMDAFCKRCACNA